MLPASRVQTSSFHCGAGVILRAPSWPALEVAVAPVAAGEPEQHEVGRQQAAVGEVVDRRQQLLARQVAGDAEDDQRARFRYPRQPPVGGIAQRVRCASARRSPGRRAAAGTVHARSRSTGLSGCLTRVVTVGSLGSVTVTPAHRSARQIDRRSSAFGWITAGSASGVVELSLHALGKLCVGVLELLHALDLEHSR